MRKSSLVKAMACFMAATMAVTCMPGVNVTNGMMIAEAAIVPDSFESATGEILAIVPAKASDTDRQLLANPYSVSGDFNVEATFTGKTTSGRVDLPGVWIEGDSSLDWMYVRSDNFITWQESDGWSNDAIAAKKLKNGKNLLNFSCTENGENSSDWVATMDALAKEGANETITLSRKDGTVRIDFKIESLETASKKVKFTIGYEFDSTDDLTFYFGSWTADPEVSYRLISYTDYANFLPKKLPEGVSKNADGVYEINPTSGIAEASGTTANGVTKYTVDLSKIFVPKEQMAYDVVENEVTSPAITVENIKGNRVIKFPIKVLKGNKASSLKITSGNNTKISLGKSFDVEATVTGVDAKATVTDLVTFSAIDATVTQKSKTGNNYVFTVTPTQTGPGKITFKCGDKTATVSYEVASNLCSKISVNEGYSHMDTVNNIYYFMSPANRVFSLNITAEGELADRPLPYDIEMVSGTAIKFVTEGAIKELPNKIRTASVVTETIKVGENEPLKFRCGDKELTVIITGTESGTTQGNSTTTTPGTGTTTPSTDTPSTTPGAVTPDTPSTDNNTPSTDNNTPSTDNNTPSTDNNNTSDDNNDDTKTKTTKKKAKVASVTAKKGKKVVSGTVKISATGKKVSKATVKVYVNNKKKATVKTKSSGKFSVKLSKKLKKGDKVKLVITKSNIKKITKTVKVK